MVNEGLDTSNSSVTAKQTLQSGTISKVSTGHNSQEFTDADIQYLWKLQSEAISELDKPELERYTRHTSDLIRRISEHSEKLIMAGAIKEYASRKDTAIYVWKILKDRNIQYNKSHFYQLLSPEQKRPYQTPTMLEKVPDKSHKHNFSIFIGNFEGVGEVFNCAASGDVLCQAKMMDGQVYENAPDADSDADLLKKPKRDPIFYEDENRYALHALQKAIDTLKFVQKHYIRHPAFSMLDEKAKREFRETLLMVEKASDFARASYNDKTKIMTQTEHKLVFSYAEETQNAAGGLYLWLLRLFGARKVETAKEVLSNYLVPKQTTKKMAGKTLELHPRYDPKNEEEAMDRGFYGTKCSNEKCPSFGYRIDYDRVIVDKKVDETTGEERNVYDDRLICFACGKKQESAPTIRLEKMHSKSQMISCGDDIRCDVE